MTAELRWAKVFGRLNSDEKVRRRRQYVNWGLSKPKRLRNGWTRFLGRNRSCIDARIAGYIGRKRQIKNCFMKGWC